VFKETDAPSAKPAPDAPPPETGKPVTSVTPVEAPPKPAVPPPQAASSATIVMRAEPKKLLFCHLDGWNMDLADGDILGRSNGNHTDRLGAIPVISGTHAKITRENGAWYITDQKSTNKTYVGGMLAQPGVPVPIKNNDVVQLANVKFTVRET
jgi:predicted component of type VI protein secretion system